MENSYTYIPGYKTIIDNEYYTVTYSEKTKNYIFLWKDKDFWSELWKNI